MVTVEQNSGVTDLKFSPAVDAVQEFKVQTNFFSGVRADGRSRREHGDQVGHEQVRRHGVLLPAPLRLNANDWFSNRAAADAPYSAAIRAAACWAAR